jgi:transcriptional regulator with XRE-family HTH domain
MNNKQVINAFGLRIKSLRTQRNISQEKLSFLTGFHRTYIGMVERGERNISLSNISVFAKVFEMTLSELFNFEIRETKTIENNK